MFIHFIVKTKIPIRIKPKAMITVMLSAYNKAIFLFFFMKLPIIKQATPYAINNGEIEFINFNKLDVAQFCSGQIMNFTR